MNGTMEFSVNLAKRKIEQRKKSAVQSMGKGKTSLHLPIIGNKNLNQKLFLQA